MPAHDLSKLFKKACPAAYSYTYDDPTSIHAPAPITLCLFAPKEAEAESLHLPLQPTNLQWIVGKSIHREMAASAALMLCELVVAVRQNNLLSKIYEILDEFKCIELNSLIC
ncbi:hypothetical protein ZIOFF_043024 [Zingiber officinale]|uniref:Uncharacterized protein n=1 Tax=Zingiber officinale TaxID=94328 RepID=A0A8J5FSJ8_ZINOF|nr:hypothetical protein ZIOFF_043024 [Zingiber officinale]